MEKRLAWLIFKLVVAVAIYVAAQKISDTFFAGAITGILMYASGELLEVFYKN